MQIRKKGRIKPNNASSQKTTCRVYFTLYKKLGEENNSGLILRYMNSFLGESLEACCE